MTDEPIDAAELEAALAFIDDGGFEGQRARVLIYRAAEAHLAHLQRLAALRDVHDNANWSDK